jgi:hypothetical protein
VSAVTETPAFSVHDAGIPCTKLFLCELQATPFDKAVTLSHLFLSVTEVESIASHLASEPAPVQAKPVSSHVGCEVGTLRV